MKLAIYYEQCTQAGRQVGDQELEQAEADNDGRDCDPWEDGDWGLYEGTPEELLEMALTRELRARPGGGGTYDRRVAGTIRDAVYSEHPELEPDVEDVEAGW